MGAGGGAYASRMTTVPSTYLSMRTWIRSASTRRATTSTSTGGTTRSHVFASTFSTATGSRAGSSRCAASRISSTDIVIGTDGMPSSGSAQPRGCGTSM